MKSLKKQSEPMLDMPSMESYPCFYVCDEQMSEIADWEIGGEYTLMVKVRVSRKSQEYEIEGTDTDATLEVLSYEVQK